MIIKRAILLLFFAVVIFSTQCFRFVYWKQFAGGLDQYYYALYPLIVIFAIPCFFSVYKRLLYTKEVLAIGVIPYLCIITIIAKGSGFNSQFDLPPMLFSMAIFSYFLLAHYHVSKKAITNSILAIGLFVFLIQVIQQLNPSIALFGIINPEDAYINGDIATIRNNLYRFLLPTYQLSLVCLFYWWSRVLKKSNIISIFLFACFATSVYLYLTRQIIFSAIAVLALTPLILKKQKKSAIWISVIFIVGIYLSASTVLGDFIDATLQGGESAEYRLASYPFFITKIKESFLTFLFGSGTPKETVLWHEMGLNASDIGFVGEVFHKGIFSLIIYLVLLYKILIKNGKYTPTYIKLYLICSFVFSVTAFPYIQGYEYFLWAILLYLSDYETEKTKSNMLTHKKN